MVIKMFLLIIGVMFGCIVNCKSLEEVESQETTVTAIPGTLITLETLSSLVQLDDIPIPSGDLTSLRSSRVTDSNVQLVSDEAVVSQLELIPFIDCVSRDTGKRFPTIDDVLARLERYTLSEFIDKMFQCLQSKAFKAKRKLRLLRQTATGLVRIGGLRPEERPKKEQPEDVERPNVKPGKVELPEEAVKPSKIERPEEPLVVPKPGKERGDGRIEIFFVRLRWVLWQYLRQLKKQGSSVASAKLQLDPAESRTIFFHSDPIYNTNRLKGYRYQVTRVPVVSRIDCILFNRLKCNTLAMDTDISPAHVPVRVTSHLASTVIGRPYLDHKFISYDQINYDGDNDLTDDEDDDSLNFSDEDNIGGLIADGIEDVAKTVYRFGGGFRRVQKHFNRFLTSGADLILG